MNKIYCYFIFLLLINACAADGGNEPFNPTLAEGFEYKYYVPADIEDAVNELIKSLDNEQKLKFEEIDNELSVTEEHHQLGDWMQKYWLYDSSRLSEYFVKHYIERKEHMSGTILRSFWAHLKGKSIDFEEVSNNAKRSEYAIFRPAVDKCPDGSGSEFKYELMGTIFIEGELEFVHVGVCDETGQYWIYRLDGTWMPAEGRLINEIEILKQM